MIRLLSGIVILLSATVLSACTKSNQVDQTHSFRIYEENGITIAETTGGPKYTHPIFEFEEVVRLKQDESQEESLLNRVNQYLMGDDGHFYVLDRGNQRIAVFDQAGEYVRSFGRSGSGPGEFTDPRLFSIFNNKVAVLDTRIYRVSIFNVNGTFLESFSYQMSELKLEIHLTAEDNLVLVSRKFDHLQDNREYSRGVVTIVTVEGDTITQMDTPPYFEGRRFSLNEYGISGLGQVFYGSRSRATFNNDKGILIYTTSEPELRWHELDGSQRYIVRLKMEPELVTRNDRRAISRLWDKQIESASGEQGKALLQGWKDNVIIPGIKSYWASVLVDDTGYSWLQYHIDYASYINGSNTPTFRVLSPEGEYLGDATWPSPMANISHGHLLTIFEDEETGQRTLVVYKIVPTVSGLEFP